MDLGPTRTKHAILHGPVRLINRPHPRRSTVLPETRRDGHLALKAPLRDPASRHHGLHPFDFPLIKAIRLLAYLKGTPDLGPTWLTNEGPVLIASCDAAFAVHPLTGGSQLSVSFRIGTDNAPFHVISKIQTTKISLNPTHSEYNAFSIATENIKFYRTYLAWLGYPQIDPTPLETDCAPAFIILLAPDFPKNSKIQDCSVREAYCDKIFTPVHVLSKGFATDLNAKPSGPTDFKAKRAKLLNIAANPAFAKYL